MLSRLKRISTDIGKRLIKRRDWLWVLLVDLIKDRYNGAINEYLDKHASGILAAIAPLVRWFVSTPFGISLVVLTLVIAGVIIHAAIDEARYKAKSPIERPEHRSSPAHALIGGTKEAEDWLYIRLKEIYKRSFEDEEVRLDGCRFIECVWGKGVVFRYDGLAPCELMRCEPQSPINITFKTGNMPIKQFIDLGQTWNLFRPHGFHSNPPQKTE